MKKPFFPRLEVDHILNFGGVWMAGVAPVEMMMKNETDRRVKKEKPHFWFLGILVFWDQWVWCFNSQKCQG